MSCFFIGHKIQENEREKMIIIDRSMSFFCVSTDVQAVYLD